MSKFKISIETTEDGNKQVCSLERENDDEFINFTELFTGFLDVAKGLSYQIPKDVQDIID